MATNTSQGHVLAPTATVFPVDALVISASQDHVYLALITTVLPVDTLVISAS
jgi:hypothetical protein